jgi:hypothetical protein
MNLTPNTRAILHIAPGKYASCQGMEVTILQVFESWGTAYCCIAFDNSEKADVPMSYLRPVEAPRQTRRSPLMLKPERDNRTEQAKQSEAVSWLQARGYTVLVTGAFVRRIQCEKCGAWQWPHNGFGNAPGVPDLLISHPRFGTRIWTVLEFKQSAKAKRKPEQVALVEKGLSVFVWSLQMAITAVYEVEVSLGLEPHEELTAWLQRHNCLPESEAIK